MGFKFKVEVEDPHAPDDRNDERFECETAIDAASRFEDVGGRGHVATNAILLVRGVDLEHVDPESGVTVTAQRLVAA